jgi:hypothetical protein
MSDQHQPPYGPDDCHRCWGSGHIANSDDAKPWPCWADLKPPSNLAVTLGLVQPEPCPQCGGSGKRADADRQAREGR